MTNYHSILVEHFFKEYNTIPKWNESEIRTNHTYQDTNNQSQDLFAGLESVDVFFFLSIGFGFFNA